MKTNLEIVQEAYFNFSQGNIPAMLDAMSEGIEWELPSSAHVNFVLFALGFSLCSQCQRP